MLSLTAKCAAALGCVAIIFIKLYLEVPSSRRHLRSKHPLPPGPPGLPWLGNVIGFDANTPWTSYRKWAKEYGDLIYIRFMGKEIIVINSETIARDLLDARSRNYSDRPFFITNTLCGLDFNTGMLPYGDTWRRHRRFFNQTFKKVAISRFHPLQFRQNCRLLRELLNTPSKLTEHVSVFATALIMSSVYDYDSVSPQDEMTTIVTRVLEVIRDALRPEVALAVGAFPQLLRLPAWLPGMSFKTEMAKAKEYTRKYVEKPFRYSVEKLADGASGPALTHDSMLYDRLEVADAETWKKDLKSAAATAFLAGSETSHSVIMMFFLMMILNPKVQEKAQAQIDLVLGGARLPTPGDRPSLPYVDAIIRELYRYHPAAPLAVPHMVRDDDVYAGFYIPKGAIVHTNLWSMSRDETRFHDPEKFIPERFLDNDGSLLPDDTKSLLFGFGRRICPGRHFVDETLWSAAANLLAVFHISKAKDANGVEIPIEPGFSSGITLRPLPFACSIVPRDPGMNAQRLEELIAATTMAREQ